MPRKQLLNMNEKENKEPEYVVNLEDLPKPELSGHQWLQLGNQLVCQSCPFTHATFIDVGYQLYGIDERGIPMIRKIKSSQ